MLFDPRRLIELPDIEQSIVCES